MGWEVLSPSHKKHHSGEEEEEPGLLSLSGYAQLGGYKLGLPSAWMGPSPGTRNVLCPSKKEPKG